MKKSVWLIDEQTHYETFEDIEEDEDQDMVAGIDAISSLDDQINVEAEVAEDDMSNQDNDGMFGLSAFEAPYQHRGAAPPTFAPLPLQAHSSVMLSQLEDSSSGASIGLSGFMEPTFSHFDDLSTSRTGHGDRQPYEFVTESIEDGPEVSTTIAQHLFGAPAFSETRQPPVFPPINEQYAPLGSTSGTRRRGIESVYVGRYHPYVPRPQARPAAIDSSDVVVSSNGRATDQDPSRIFDLDYSFDFDLFEAEQDWLN